MTPRAAKLVSRVILVVALAVFAAQFVLRLTVGDRNDTAEIVVVGDPQAPGMAQVRSELEADLAQGARLHAIAEKFASGIRGARKAEIPGAAHAPSLERPQEFDRLVLAFLGAR